MPYKGLAVWREGHPAAHSSTRRREDYGILILDGSPSLSQRCTAKLANLPGDDTVTIFCLQRLILSDIPRHITWHSTRENNWSRHLITVVDYIAGQAMQTEILKTRR